jgi:ankyrin repeat protein
VIRLCWVLVIACAWGQQSPPSDALAEAASRCDSATVRRLLEQGVNPNAPDRNGETALMRAVTATSHCDASLVRLLLDKGADVNVRASRGDTPLMRAVTGHASERGIIRPSVPVVQLLLDYGPETPQPRMGIRRFSPPVGAVTRTLRTYWKLAPTNLTLEIPLVFSAYNG